MIKNGNTSLKKCPITPNLAMVIDPEWFSPLQALILSGVPAAVPDVISLPKES